MAERPAVLNRETLIPIGLAIGCLIPLSFGIMWVRDGQSANAAAIEKLREEMGYRFDALSLRTQDNVTGAQLERWILRLERDNPGAIKVPEWKR
jgi:hypothetical protein